MTKFLMTVFAITGLALSALADGPPNYSANCQARTAQVLQAQYGVKVSASHGYQDNKLRQTEMWAYVAGCNGPAFRVTFSGYNWHNCAGYVMVRDLRSPS